MRAAVGGVLPGGLKLAGLDVQALPPPAPPPLSPYVFSAERAGNAIVLSGAAPSPETRALLLDLAGHGGREVVDRTRIASGEPVGFATFAAHGLSQVARMSAGRFTLTDASYALEGEAADFDAYDAVRLDLRTAPQGVSLARVDVQPPLLKPYAFSVAREGAAVVLRGAFPDEATREAVLAMARALFPGVALRNEARIARGAPQGFSEIARAALGALAGMSSGSVSFAAGALSLNGAAAGPASELVATLKGLLPAGVSLDLAALQASPSAGARSDRARWRPRAVFIGRRTVLRARPARCRCGGAHSFRQRARPAAAAVRVRNRARGAPDDRVRRRHGARLRPHGRRRQSRAKPGAVGPSRRRRGADAA